MAQLLSFLSGGDRAPISAGVPQHLNRGLSSGTTRTRASDSYPTHILRGIQPRRKIFAFLPPWTCRGYGGGITRWLARILLLEPAESNRKFLRNGRGARFMGLTTQSTVGRPAAVRRGQLASM